MPPSTEDVAETATPLNDAGRRVLLVGADRALADLLAGWLVDEGWIVVQPGEPAVGRDARVDLAVVDVPFPRQGGVDCIKRVASRNIGVPILALSSTFYSGVDCHGPVARELGVACVLPNPVSHEVLINAVRRVLRGSPDCDRPLHHGDSSIDPGRA